MHDTTQVELDEQRVEEVAQAFLAVQKLGRIKSFQRLVALPLLVYCYLSYKHGLIFPFIGVVIAILNLFVNVWMVRRPSTQHLAGPFFLAGTLVLLSLASLQDGLLQSPSLWLMMIVPLVSALTIGSSAPRRYLGICLGALALVALVDVLELLPALRVYSNRALFRMRMLVLILLTSLGLIAAWHSMKQSKKIAVQSRAIQQASEKVQAASQSKSKFLATMSHEIRTPMNGILGTAQHLSMGELEAKQRHYNDVILASGSQLMDVLNSILDLSKIEAGKFELRCSELRLDRLFRDVTAENAELYAAQGIEIRVRGGDLPLRLRGDGIRVEQVLRNLLSVVAESCVSKRIEVQLGIEGLDAVIEIATAFEEHDPLLLETLRSPQIAMAQRPNESHRLALVMKVSQALIELMGGTFSVRCGSDQHYRLRWTFPLPVCEFSQDSAPWNSQSMEIRVDSWEGLEVLVVDDNAINVRVAQKQLEHLGCVVSSACDGEEALACCASKRFAIVFMDLQMPRMRGEEAARRIRASGGPNRETAIVAFTANAYDADLAALHDAGFDAQLSKPFRVEALKRVLAKFGRDESSQLVG